MLNFLVELSFFAMPNKSEISPLSGNSHYLRCGGDEKLKISIKPSNYTSFATIRVQDDKKETMTMSEKGYIIEINKITQDVQIECKDSKISHIWNINMPQIPRNSFNNKVFENLLLTIFSVNF